MHYLDARLSGETGLVDRVSTVLDSSDTTFLRVLTNAIRHVSIGITEARDTPRIGMKYLRSCLRAVNLLLALAGLIGGAHAASVSFAWKPNSEPALAGYKLYYGPASATYTNHIALGLVTNHTVPGLVNGATYYFALSAFDTNGVESDLTPELRFPNPPALAAIANQSTPEDTSLTVNLVVSDADSPLSNLTLAATSSNVGLVANANISFSGSGSNRSMLIVPTANQSGTSTVTVTVSDGSLTSSRNFVLTVSGTPDAPTISSITDVTVDEDVVSGAISFTVNDLETAATNLTVRATTSNSTLIPTNRITFAGTGASRTVTLRPATNQSGSASITLTVSDGTLSSSTTFNFTVRPLNDLPTITAIADLTLAEDTASSAIAFTINDVETAPASLQVTASSSNPSVVPQQNITLGGTGTNRTVTVRPITNAVGNSLVTVTVNDGQATASEAFTVTFTGVNDAPSISQPADVVVNKFNPVPPVPFTISDVETSATALTITLTSSNATLLPLTNIVLSGTGGSRSLALTPIGVGVSRVGINVSDGAATTSVFFLLTVNSSNNPPVLTVPASLSGTAGAPITLAGISVVDLDIKTNNMNFTITGANGTFSVSTTVSGGVKAAQVSGNNSASVTIVAPVAALNATFAASNGLAYTSRGDFRGTQPLTLTVSDNGFTGLGGTKTDTETISMQITGASSLEQWRTANFSAADLQDPSKEATVWGDLADPDSDGRENLMEFALGLNPLGSEPQETALLSQTLSTGGNQYLTLTFNARINEPTLQYLPEVSADNVTWSATAVLITSTPVNTDFSRLTYRDPVAITSAAARFIRLRVVKNSP